MPQSKSPKNKKKINLVNAQRAKKGGKKVKKGGGGTDDEVIKNAAAKAEMMQQHEMLVNVHREYNEKYRDRSTLSKNIQKKVNEIDGMLMIIDSGSDNDIDEVYISNTVKEIKSAIASITEETRAEETRAIDAEKANDVVFQSAQLMQDLQQLKKTQDIKEKEDTDSQEEEEEDTVSQATQENTELLEAKAALEKAALEKAASEKAQAMVKRINANVQAIIGSETPEKDIVSQEEKADAEKEEDTVSLATQETNELQKAKADTEKARASVQKARASLKQLEAKVKEELEKPKRLAEIWNENKKEYMSSITNNDDKNKYNKYVMFNKKTNELVIIDNNDKDSFPLCFIVDDANNAKYKIDDSLDDDDVNKKLADLIDLVY